jgi:hypothetical protein
MQSNAESKPTFQEALERWRNCRAVVETALDKAGGDERKRLRTRYDEIAAEIRRIQRLSLDKITETYVPLTQAIRNGINPLKDLQQKIVELNNGVKEATEVISIIDRAVALVTP